MWFLFKLVLGAIWFFLTIGVLVNIWAESKQESLNKLLWTLGILLFPIAGPVAWMLYVKK